jgi:putative Ca2+/H+ antiporter (TMEM165/GDT1 family)
MSLIVFRIVFGLLFLGELGDKTQLSVFNITLGVFFGTIITQFIPVFYITLLSLELFLL